MIVLQVISGVLLIPLLALMLLAFNNFIKHGIWYLAIIILGLLISGSIGVLFWDISYAAYSGGAYLIIYTFRTYKLVTEFRDKKIKIENRNKNLIIEGE